MVILAETSSQNPALSDFRDRLFLAWTGRDDHHRLNVISSADGTTFENKQTLADTSIAGPALGVFRDRLFLAWTGRDDHHRLNVISSADGTTFENKQTLADTSIAGPALGVFRDRLFLAWTGRDDHHRLNVISSADGTTFENKQTLADTSIAGPALAPFERGLFIAWTGRDDAHHLNGMPSTDGIAFANKRTLNEPGEDLTSFTGPALIAETEPINLLLAWSDFDGHLNLLQTDNLSSAGGHFDNFQRFSDTSIAGPALAELFVNDAITPFIAWAGTNNDHNLNVKQVPDLTEI